MHNHQHHHHHAHTDNHHLGAFAIAVGLNSLFVIIEAVYALEAHSMSLLADAGHNLGDVMGLSLAWLASWLLTQKASARYSYGYKKITIFASLINALLLVATSTVIAIASYNKLFDPSLINEPTVMMVATLGMFINAGTAMLFWRNRNTDLNLKAAYLHLMMDALIAASVIITGAIIYLSGCKIFDPLLGLLIVVTILYSTWELLRNSINLLLDAVPHAVNAKAVREYLTAINGVSMVHDLHIWGLSTRETALTAHLVMPGKMLDDNQLASINEHLREQFQIHHVTLQVEQGHAHDPCGRTITC